MKYGYARVSSEDQNSAKELGALKAHPRKLIEQGNTATDAARIIGIGRTTLYDALHRDALR